MPKEVIKEYIGAINTQQCMGAAGEHTYRPALQRLLKVLQHRPHGGERAGVEEAQGLAGGAASEWRLAVNGLYSSQNVCKNRTEWGATPMWA